MLKVRTGAPLGTAATLSDKVPSSYQDAARLPKEPVCLLLLLLPSLPQASCPLSAPH